MQDNAERQKSQERVELAEAGVQARTDGTVRSLFLLTGTTFRTPFPLGP